MTVLSLKLNDPSHYTVTFDNGAQVRSTLNAVTDCRISEGKCLSRDEYDGFVYASERSMCMEHAVRLLSLRPMSRKELAKKLTEKGEDRDISENVSERMAELGLIDELSYSRAVVRHYAEKGFGRSRIISELIRRGIPRDLFEEALEEMPDQEDRIDSFIRRRLTDPGDRKEIKRISDALFRKGYSWSEIRAAFERVGEDLNEY